ncbi:MAG: pyrroline-5-carboxylate reductase [Desulfurivibrionaceae bacterium]|nr:pyrroline-5-carboxylate reductase [Pseudomonadota bacterium]MBU4408050.1 pyrroline-5-carboxylate reductase [Pseudomonadota bacterium]MBU4412300.1 pyrroline-5-carboxylate reductase [Pseudomonadota bacterium]MCG2823331.1 pyrroline-5-carboxylate reductase [Desulfobulbaceae bacterium]MDP2001641.1 pyrroline-5-carboxylate reductase [Desulfurivibrionaceae bacterium]
MGFSGKLGFVGGGLMAEALIKGITGAGLVKADQILVADPSSARRALLQKDYNVTAVSEATAVWAECKVVVLAVKPQVIGAVLCESREAINATHLLISIAAGVPLSVLEGAVSGRGCRVIRVMPNTPAIVLKGASALSPGQGVNPEDLAVATSIFDAVGVSFVLDESYLDAVTGLSGSGPAYVFTFIEALIDAGVKVGLARPVAQTLALQTVLGSVLLALDGTRHPAELRAMVTSPGGTTIAGLHELEKGAFRALVTNAVEAATNRSSELGRLVVSGFGKELPQK